MSDTAYRALVDKYLIETKGDLGKAISLAEAEVKTHEDYYMVKRQEAIDNGTML